MTSARARLTPQMLEYAEKFDDRGEIRWLPYLMYFHPANHRSAVVNTDRLGFRLCCAGEAIASVGGVLPPGPVRLLAGSSTVFGIGATNDAATLSSRLWARHAPAAAWLNFGGRSYNSTQELLLFVLYRHLLEQVEEVVILSGFNDLGLSRLPAAQRGDHGAFFNSGEYFEQMERLRARRQRGSTGTSRSLLRRSGTRPPPAGNAVPGLGEQISLATELTVRNLDTWRALTEPAGTRLTYVLQPLATWVRPQPAPQERLLFEELDKISNFHQVYGDIAAMDTGRHYASALQAGCAKIGVRFLDLSPVIEAAIRPSDWLFVDRIHFTDSGYDLAAELLADSLGLT